MKTLLVTTIALVTFFTMNTATPKNDVVVVKQHKDIIAIAKMIKAIKPKLANDKTIKLADQLFITSKKYNIDPKVMIAIIDTESDFDNTKISETGDLSLAQINTDIWNKELKRMKLPEIDSKRLKIDEKYALNQMAMILSILKNRHSHKDGIWFARYHSHTKKFKNQYYAKVDLRMRKIASVY